MPDPSSALGEAKSLLNLVTTGAASVQDVHSLIGLSRAEEETLRAFSKSDEAARRMVTVALGFRRRVLREFERLVAGRGSEPALCGIS